MKVSTRVPFFLIAVTLLTGCVSPHLYIKQEKTQRESIHKKIPTTGYVAVVSVSPRIGLFDELIYSCKEDFEKRIADSPLTTSGILPLRWDGVFPTKTKEKSGCSATHFGNLSLRHAHIEGRKDGKLGTNCKWNLSADFSSASEKITTTSCVLNAVVKTNEIASFSVEVGGSEPIRGTVPQDFVIVSMGDSYASGEGNPDRARAFAGELNGVAWMSQRCHRSLWAGPIRAGLDRAERYVKQDDGSWANGAYTILSTACSGAEIPDLYAPDYPGRETVSQMRAVYESQLGDYPGLASKHLLFSSIRRLDSQIEQVKGVLETSDRRADKKPVIDALIVSSGGNDINFGSLVSALFTNQEILKEINTEINFDIAKLDNRYKIFQSTLAHEISVGQIYLTAYPDPTKTSDDTSNGAATTYCSCNGNNFIGLGLIEQLFFCLTKSANSDASTYVVQPLNKKLWELSRKYGWYMLDNIEKKGSGHAWCQDRQGDHARWFRTFRDSVELQGTLPGYSLLSTGAMHPTANGHESMYKPAILEALDYNNALQFSIDPPVGYKGKIGFSRSHINIKWDGDVFFADNCKGNDIRKCGSDKFSVASPDVVRVMPNGEFERCKYGKSLHQCYIMSIDFAAKKFVLYLPEDESVDQLVRIRARDANRLKLQSPIEIGPLRIVNSPPKISCQLMYAGGDARDCISIRGWQKGEDLEILLAAKDHISGIGKWTINGNDVVDTNFPQNIVMAPHRHLVIHKSD